MKNKGEDVKLLGRSSPEGRGFLSNGEQDSSPRGGGGGGGFLRG